VVREPYFELDDVNIVVADPLVALVCVRPHGFAVRMLYLPSIGLQTVADLQAEQDPKLGGLDSTTVLGRRSYEHLCCN
jgi:hypothetical protein